MKVLFGGLVEFYPAPARKQWPLTGTNMRDYPEQIQLFK